MRFCLAKSSIYPTNEDSHLLNCCKILEFINCFGTTHIGSIICKPQSWTNILFCQNFINEDSYLICNNAISYYWINQKKKSLFYKYFFLVLGFDMYRAGVRKWLTSKGRGKTLSSSPIPPASCAFSLLSCSTQIQKRETCLPKNHMTRSKPTETSKINVVLFLLVFQLFRLYPSCFQSFF